MLAPDLRGYNLSDKPEGVDAYRLDVLAADVIGLAEHVGGRPLCLVGHDWGGLLAWWTAMRHPERIARLAILNAPHPACLRDYLREHRSQRLRSWYVGFFQLPRLPEALAGAARCWALRRALRASSRPGTFSDGDLQRYVAAWSQERALTSMINWYRALRRSRPTRREARIRCPTLVLWGAADRFLERGLADASLRLCDEGTLAVLGAATHWLQHEEPDAVNAALTGFLAGAARGGGERGPPEAAPVR